MAGLDDDFKKFFPALNFRLKDFQKSAVQNVLSTNATLCIMPTGAGKSLIYQLAALKLGGTALVISPLIALIVEQAEKIRTHGFDVLEFHGGIDSATQTENLKAFVAGKILPRFIFASPEKLATDGFFEFCLRRRRDEIKLVVIDEVHCVSQWGMNFRPFYKRIPDFLNRIFGADAWSKILALTATLNPKELADICTDFKIRSENVLRHEILTRSEIKLHVKKFDDENAKELNFWEIVDRHRGEKILVYVYRKYNERGTEKLCATALEKGYKAAYFHGDLSVDERRQIIDEYRRGALEIIFATNAFGMGIDIKDIRVVIHFMIPDSAEQFYQEIGRAARDGNSANAYLLYSDKNIDVKRKFFIDASFPTEKNLTETFKKFGGKIGLQTLAYFDDEEIQNCLPYLLTCGALEIVCKAFANLSDFEDITDAELKKFFDGTRTKSFVSTVKKFSLSPEVLAEKVFEALLNGRVKAKNLKRRLVINLLAEKLSPAQIKIMTDDIAAKKTYRHELLNFFVGLLKNNSADELHSEIAIYLGANKFNAKKIHATADGNFVRSKSEVIIANLLHAAGLNYRYEEPLEVDGKEIFPDFTIFLSGGQKIFWEHVGMLGVENYDKRWSEKLALYKSLRVQPFRTYESGAISADAQKIIDELKNLDTD